MNRDSPAGCSWQKPGTKDRRADPELQKKFQEELGNRMDNEPQTRFFFTDEAIFQSAATVTSAWSLRGERPIVGTDPLLSGKTGRARFAGHIKFPFLSTDYIKDRLFITEIRFCP